MKKKSYERRKPTILRMLLKLALALFLGLFIWAICLVTLEDISESGYDRDESNKVNACNWDYYEGNYGYLKDYLELYDLRSDTYAIYWEVIDGYEDYLDYQKWSQVTEEQIPGSSQRALTARQQVLENAEDCQFEKNQRTLDLWAEQVRQAENESLPADESPKNP